MLRIHPNVVQELDRLFGEGKAEEVARSFRLDGELTQFVTGFDTTPVIVEEVDKSTAGVPDEPGLVQFEVRLDGGVAPPMCFTLWASGWAPDDGGARFIREYAGESALPSDLVLHIQRIEESSKEPQS